MLQQKTKATVRTLWLRSIAVTVAATWLCALTVAAEAAAPQVTDVHVDRYGEGTRLVVELTGSVDFQVFALAGPERLVIDLSPVRWVLPERTLAIGRDGVAQVRFGQFRPDTSRIVIDLDLPLILGSAQWLEADAVSRNPYRLILDLAPVPASAFLATVRVQPSEPSPLPRLKPLLPSLVRLIALDPGHGGRDPGAVSSGGVQEKVIVLTFARELRDVLQETGRYRVAMTRDSDRKVGLWQRVAFARNAGADVLLSIHIDRVNDRRVRGASVYTLSEEASDAETAELARLENKADIAAGIEAPEHYDPDVAAVLASMEQQGTMNCSVVLAGLLVPALGSVAPLVNRSHRFAEFRVLKAPDVPSVLIELGFLSNEQDAERIKSESHRRALADAIVNALDAYFLEPC